MKDITCLRDKRECLIVGICLCRLHAKLYISKFEALHVQMNDRFGFVFFIENAVRRLIIFFAHENLTKISELRFFGENNSKVRTVT